MKQQLIMVAFLASTLGGCGVVGAKGNYSVGIIPWSPEAELSALDTAQTNCGRYDEYAVVTNVHREYGDYISYECQFNPPPRQIPISHLR